MMQSDKTYESIRKELDSPLYVGRIDNFLAPEESARLSKLLMSDQKDALSKTALAVAQFSLYTGLLLDAVEWLTQEKHFTETAEGVVFEWPSKPQWFRTEQIKTKEWKLNLRKALDPAAETLYHEFKALGTTPFFGKVMPSQLLPAIEQLLHDQLNIERSLHVDEEFFRRSAVQYMLIEGRMFSEIVQILGPYGELGQTKYAQQMVRREIFKEDPEVYPGTYIKRK